MTWGTFDEGQFLGMKKNAGYLFAAKIVAPSPIRFGGRGLLFLMERREMTGHCASLKGMQVTNKARRLLGKCPLAELS
jgi:hypothetical protein